MKPLDPIMNQHCIFCLILPTSISYTRTETLQSISFQPNVKHNQNDDDNRNKTRKTSKHQQSYLKNLTTLSDTTTEPFIRYANTTIKLSSWWALSYYQHKQTQLAVLFQMHDLRCEDRRTEKKLYPSKVTFPPHITAPINSWSTRERFQRRRRKWIALEVRTRTPF